jgi:hypothetical protein
MCSTNTCGYENMYIVQYSMYGRESEVGKVKLKITLSKHKTLIFNVKAYRVDFFLKLT